MHRKNVRSLALILCTLTYLVIGAAVFDALESDTDMKHRQVLTQLKQHLQNKYNFTKADYSIFEAVAIKSVPHKAGRQWKFSGAFYFATLVITMVGYGHSTPDTFLGKLFCIIYALCGIPLGLVMFQSIGERVNALISFTLKRIKRGLPGLGIGDISSTHLIMVSSSIGSLVICLGTYVFHRYEGWSLFESYYYCFITLTTIGFGDYVALQKPGMLENNHAYVIFTLTFILFGLAIFSAAVNLFVLRFMATNSDKDSNADTAPQKGVTLESLSNDFDEKNVSIDSISAGPGGMRQSSVSQIIPILTRTFSRKSKTAENRKPEKIKKSQVDHGFNNEALFCARSPMSLPRVTCNRRDCSMRARIIRSKWAQCLGLDSCFGFGSSRNEYTVRRGPCRISHLVAVGAQVRQLHADTPSMSPNENDSFILHDLTNRRTSL